MNYEHQTDFSNMPINDGTAAAFIAGFFGVIFIIALTFYIYLAVCLMKIAKKTNTPNAWFAWIPILNVILMLQIAKKPMWWLFPFFIPFVNIIFSILVWMEIARAVGKPEWWGILMIIPFVNLVVPGYLAFSGEDVHVETHSQRPLQSSGQAPQAKQETAQTDVVKEDADTSADDDSGNGDE
jgi:hypothetical protein